MFNAQRSKFLSVATGWYIIVVRQPGVNFEMRFTIPIYDLTLFIGSWGNISIFSGWFWAGSDVRLGSRNGAVTGDWSKTGGAGEPQPDNREFKVSFFLQNFQYS